MPETRYARWWAACSLAVLIVLAYANALPAGLTLDSDYVVGLDPRIRTWSAENLRLIWGESYWWPSARSDLYRPLTTMSYLASYTLLGNEDRVFGYHVVNVSLHAVNTWLAFAVLGKIGARTAVAWLTSAIFAVHPVNVEVVTNIAGRADLLATAAVLASGWCYVHAVGNFAKISGTWLALAGLFATVGVFAKENAIMVLAFAVLYDVFWRWPLLRGSTIKVRIVDVARNFGLKGWVAFVPAIALLWIVRERLAGALTPAGQAFVDNPILFAGAFQGCLTAVGVIGRYLAHFFLPAKLSCDYSYNQIPLYGEEMFWWQVWIPWLSLIVLAGLGWLVMRWRGSLPLVAWGMAFFFVMLLPVSNLLIRIGSIMADRFLYLPSIGLCVAVAVGIDAIRRRASHPSGKITGFRRAAAFGLPALVLGALVVRTHARNADWRDDRSLWRSAVAAAPHSFKTHLGYSAPLWEAERNEAALDRAIAQAEEAGRILERVPLPAERLPQTVFSQLGTFYRFKGEFLMARNSAIEAKSYLERSIALLEKARAIDQRENEALFQQLRRRSRVPSDVVLAGNAKIYLELAVNHMLQKNWRELEAAAHAIQRFAPSDPGGYAFEAVADANSRRDDEAATHFFAALVLNPNDAQMRGNLAICYERLEIRPSPVGSASGAPLIDVTSPRARQHVNAAFALLVRNHDAARLHRDAAHLREVATQQFHVPAALLGPTHPP